MKLWKYRQIAGNLSLEKENPLLAKLLLSRNIDTDEKAEIFLNPEKYDYLPFSVFNDSEKVLDRIKFAVENREKIVVYGDFDTDGVTSTAILYKTLKKIGANVDYYLPDRDSENHGLNNNAIIKLISKHKAKLIITVDCGISNNSEVNLAQTFKTDVIISDHHEAPEELPKAFAIINPKAKGVLDENLSSSDIESLCYLSGAGVALKIATAVLNKFGCSEFFEEILPIATMGTIGDIVPLLLENRRIVYSGLKSIQNKVNLGITRLFENAGVKDFSSITSETVAFTAVPRLNAVGRLENHGAETAFKLLISEDENEVDAITNSLNEINETRQRLCDEAFQRADKIVKETPELFKHSIVICDEETHIGIIGLTASKLVEAYVKPAFVMRKDGDVYRCSCRGLQGVNIYQIINENKDLFLGGGGHEFAGGFSFDGNVVKFEDVRKAIDESVKRQTNGEVLPDVLNIDMKLSAEDVTVDFVKTVKKLEPFGAENPAPLFAIEDLHVADFKFMGKLQNHLKLLCCNDNGKILECIKWNTSELHATKSDPVKIAFAPEINEFNGRVSVQLLIKDLVLPNAPKETVKSAVKVIDCRNQKGGYDKIVDFLDRTKKSVAVYTEQKDIVEYFSKFEEAEGKVFSRENLPKSFDMAILIDTPPSLKFLKKIISSGVKEILLMNYSSPQIESTLSKMAGMLKYTLTSLGGKTTLKAMRGALIFDDEIIRLGLEILSDCGLAKVNVDEEGNVFVSEIHAIKSEILTQNQKYSEFEKMLVDFKNHVLKINNLPFDELKAYILG